ncbi:MAG: CDP-alcohol phosphatidyltransferase family protein [Patescibacteria group bacterium]|jgi:phosphatidylglycerophosphate synthase
MRINPANAISVLRACFAFWIAYLLLEVRTSPALVIAAAAVLVAILLDAFDGVIARQYGCMSKIGELSDIYADHILANVLWVTLAYLGSVSIWVPLVTTTRDLTVDCMRQVHQCATNQNGFEQVRQTRLHWVVDSRFMRAFYGALKMFSWMACIVSLYYPVGYVLQILVLFTVGICFVRAIPAVAASWRHVIFRPV